MVKDYMQVNSARVAVRENKLIEEFWTRAWKDEELAQVEGAYVSAREEFRYVKPLLASLPSGASILDGGCGKGEWVVALRAQGFSVVGVDISRSTIERLRTLHSNNLFRVADIRQLPFRRNSFDGYISWGVFEHFEEGLQSCMREALRVLKPGAFLAITVPFCNARHLFRLHKYGKYTPKDRFNRFYQWRLTRQELIDELNIAGFEQVVVQPAHKLEGVRRMLHNDLGLPFDSRANEILSRVGRHLLPGSLISHMLFASARKPR